MTIEDVVHLWLARAGRRAGAPGWAEAQEEIAEARDDELVMANLVCGGWSGP